MSLLSPARPLASRLARARLVFAAFATFAALAALTASPRVAHAEPGDEDAAPPTVRRTVPEPLKPWVGWALRAHPEVSCPASEDGSRVCVFPSRLRVEVSGRGARFELAATTDAPAALPLPGEAALWPSSVQLDGHAAAVVRDDDGRPVVHVGPGTHAVRGDLPWKKRPESLAVPQAVAIVTLAIDGKPVAMPARDDAGRVHLAEAHEAPGDEAEPELRVRVVRRLEDDVPASLVTRIVLDVSGREREIVLGPALPAGFAATAIETLLPVTIDDAGALHLRPSAGHFELTLHARSAGPVSRVGRPKAGDPWPAEEVWSFAARPELRAVGVEGGAAIDPRTWPMPDDWKRLPAYALQGEGELRLAEQVRGAAAAPPDALTLRRELWLDFDGAGYTARDTITGRLNQSWRFAAVPPLELGHATSDGEHVLVTRGGEGEGGGFEVRGLEANVVAESRIAGAGGALPVSGWATDFQGVSAQLHLPVGYRLLAAPGVDTAPDAWVARWRLADLFVLVVTSVTVARLAGAASGAGALLALLLTLVEPAAPRGLWFLGVLALALARLAPERLARPAGVIRALCMLILTAEALPFVRDELRTAIHPALESREAPGRLGAQEAEPQASAPPPEQDHDEGAAQDAVEAATRGPTAAPAAKTGPFEPAQAQQGLELDGVGIGGGGGADITIPGAKLDVRGGLGLSLPSGRRSRASYTYKQAAPAGPYQTGPGVPAWTGRVATLTWSGPVTRGETMRLVVAPPAVNRGLGVARALLTLALLGVLAGGKGAFEAVARHLARARGAGAATVVLAALASLLSAAPARAEMPSDAMLKELADELLANPTCFPRCAALESANLDAQGDALTVTLAAHAAAPTLLPLPAADGFALASVEVDGRDAALFRGAGGALWVRLDPGPHRVVLRGAVRARDRIDLPFPAAPPRVEARGRGWRVEGLDPEGHPSGQTVALVRDNASGGSGDDAGAHAEAPGVAPTARDLALASFVRVERAFRVDLGVSVESRVVRLGPATAAVDLRVPLLEGELPSTQVASSSARVVEVHLDPGATEFAWTSTLPEGAPLHLAATADPRVFERWSLAVGHGWHFDPQGTTPIRTSASPRELVWLPWPGEKVDVLFTRLVSADGATLTIDRADLLTTPGARTTEHTLTLRLRVSHGGEHRITLPGEVELTAFRVNGAEQPLRLEGGVVVVPLAPGKLDVTIGWRAPGGLRPVFRTPAVQLGVPAVNVSTRLAFAPDRFTLLTGGPTLGPGVLLWGTVAFVALLASFLGRVPYAPLGVGEWFLLGLGLTQGPLEGVFFVALFFFGLGARARATLGRFAYNASQLAFALLGVLAFGALYEAIERGFVGAPDVAIAGGGSHAGDLVWFVDRTTGAMPTGGALTLPTWAYRVTMLAWSLWIAAALVRWARWVGAAFATQGLWARKPAPPAPTATAAEATDAPPSSA